MLLGQEEGRRIIGVTVNILATACGGALDDLDGRVPDLVYHISVV